MIFTNFEKYCNECPYIDVKVSTKKSVDKSGEVVMVSTRITCKNFDICKRIADMREDESE